MNTKIFVAGICSAAIAIPALAMAGHEMHRDPAQPITRSAVEAKVKEHFAKVDANGDGFVMKAEADAARAKMLAEKQDHHFKTMDTNGDGSISRAEFDARHSGPMAMDHGKPEGRAMGGKMGHEGQHRFGAAMKMHRDGQFERVDADSDGRVSLAEALARPLAHFDKVDTNKDGTISADERKAAHEKMREAWRAKRS